MTQVASAELTGESNVAGSWSADLQAARQQVDKFGVSAEKSLNKAAGGGDNAVKSINGLYNSAQALAGSAVIVGAVRLGEELWSAGGAAQELTSNVNAFTSGHADEYINRIVASSDDMISRMDAARAVNDSFNYDLHLSEKQYGDLAEAATVYADVLQTSTTSAMDTLTEAVGRGNAKMLQQLGIVEKGADLQDKITQIMKAQPGITYSEATQLANLNLIMERSNQLQLQGIGAMSSAGDATERLTAEFTNAKDATGKWLADGLLPIFNGARMVNKAFTEQKDILALTSSSYEDYISQLQSVYNLQGTAAGQMDVLVSKGQALSETEYNLARAHQQVAADADRRAGMSARLAEAYGVEADAGAKTAVTTEQVSAAYQQTIDAVNAYSEAINRQAAIQIETLVGLDDFLNKGQNLANVFQYGTGILDNYNLSGAQTAKMYQELGLATGEVTQKQIDTANALRELDNLWVSGAISASEYATALKDVQGGADAAAIAQQKIFDAMGNAQTMIEQGSTMFGQYGEKLAELHNKAEGVPETFESLQQKVDQFNQLFAQLPEEQKINFSVDGIDQINTAVLQLQTAQTLAKVDAVVTADTSSATKSVDELHAQEALLNMTAGIQADTSSGEKSIAGMAAKIADLNQTVVVTVVLDDQTGGTGGHATGGPAGGVTVVGEHGPELVSLPKGSNVTTAPTTQSLLQGLSQSDGGGQPIIQTISISLVANGVNNPAELVDMVEKEIRMHGKDFARVR